MNNVEFVKAYQHWKLFEAVDTSPERFQLQLDFEQQAKRIEYLRFIIEENESDLDFQFALDVLAGEHDNDIEKGTIHD